MVTKADIIDTEKKLQEQLRKLRAVKKGLPTDGSAVETQADLARHYKVERSTIHGWVHKGMPGEPGRYVIADIDAWRTAQSDEEAALATNADSPALERWRSWKAIEAEAKVKALLGTYVEANLMRDCWTQVAARINRLMEQLGRLHGPDAELLAADAADDCERLLRSVIDAKRPGVDAASGGEVNGNGKHDATDDFSAATGDGRKRRTRTLDSSKKTAKKANQRVDRKRTNPPKRTVQRRKVQTPQASGEPVVVRGFGQW